MYIAIPTQEALGYWLKNLCPYNTDLGNVDDEQLDYFDTWLDWFVGSSLWDGNDIEYTYEYHDMAIKWLQEVGMPYEVRDEADL